MNLVIVSGPAASGKSTVGRKVAQLLGYWFLSKDEIKENLFDTEKRTTHDYLWYEKRAKKLFFDRLQKAASQNESLVIESDFIATDRRKMQGLIGNACMVELYCRAKGTTRLRRYIGRNEGGRRHAGHHDRRWYVMVSALAVMDYAGVRWPFGSTGVTDNLLDIDTTDFSKIDYEKIAKLIKRQMRK